jgi:predicted nuclease with TOPRIM domain
MELLGYLIALGVAIVFGGLLRASQQRLISIEERYRDVLDIDAEVAKRRKELSAELRRHVSELETLKAATEKAGADLTEIRAETERLTGDRNLLNEELHLLDFGFYEPRYDLSDSSKYADRLKTLRSEQKEMVKNGAAVTCSTQWTVNGSAREGQKQIRQTFKMMLRAFNGECDAAVAKVKYNNVKVMEARIQKAFEGINKLASVQSCLISRHYLELKLDELHLAHEYEEKVQAEKEEQRAIREQMREEAQAQRELEQAIREAEREEARYEKALERARQEVEQSSGAAHEALLLKIAEMEAMLEVAHEKRERALSQAQMTRSGHVYVISNIGSFGENVYKIGMTRRLDPLDRVKELSDASVPFEFDIHGIIRSDDAPSLELALHRQFAERRVNMVNHRKEFFRVGIDEIADVVQAHDADIELTLVAEAAEYRKTEALLRQRSPHAPLPDQAELQRATP